MNLSFVMITESDSDNLWSRCKALAAVTEPGDEVLLYDSGQVEHNAQTLRRFGDEIGWGKDVAVRLVALSEVRSLPDRTTLCKLATLSATLVIPDSAQPTFDGVKSLRAELRQGIPDLLLFNSARRLGNTSILPCSDANLWPASGMLEGTAARIAAMQLLPDPARLMPIKNLPQEDYESAVMHADSISFVPTTVLLIPPPVPRDPTPRIASLSGRIAAAPRHCKTELVTSAMLQFDDMLEQLDPAHVETFLVASQAFAKRLPWRLRKFVRLHEGPSGRILDDLRRGDIPSARAHLTLQLAVQNRVRIDILANEVERICSKIDQALPNPNYLMDLFQRAKRV